MSVEDIYLELKLSPLTGEVSIEDGHIKWKYDSLMVFNGDDINEHLEEVYLEDKEIIDELLDEVEDEVSLTLPEFEDTWVYFYIEK